MTDLTNLSEILLMEALNTAQSHCEQIHETNLPVPNKEAIFELEAAILKIATAYGYLPTPPTKTDDCPF